ncbi:hypothetical protein [Pyrococcus yayanosii]|uniref:Uncharacterized protein n=1 Tax=Pyrococcus yayanosii (strain CH1 / JCM 16557) TaxID=529709 RepID=F8AIP3_PYRYC|nr:hypothetical protein [Pyrococcus yayanosii]AEH24417.1 hypothetical protein PYCH_07290 [Pyrococcus yayanosii CH1]
MDRFELLLKDLSLRLPEREIKRAGEVIKAFRELASIPISPINPSRTHPLVLLKKRLGGIDREVLVSPIELKIITKANMPPWHRVFEFHLDKHLVERTQIMGVPLLLVGDERAVRLVKKILSNILPAMRERPRRISSFGNEIYMDFGGDRFVKLMMVGSTLELATHNVPLSLLPRLLGRATFILDSMFHSKNAEFYRLLFAASLDTFGHFYEFFMRHVYPKLPLEHREFLEEMHDYRNFLQLLYFHLSRINLDRIGNEVGIIIRRRSRPDRPLELAIVFREGKVEVRDRVKRSQINLLV